MRLEQGHHGGRSVTRAQRQQWNVFVLPLWQAIDEISVRVSQAYREAETEMVGERERDLQALFDELLHGTGPMSAAARAASPHENPTGLIIGGATSNAAR